MKNIFKPLSLYLFILSTLAINTPSFAQHSVPTEQVTQQVLNEIVEHNRKFTQTGEVANYIPELSKANPNHIAIAVVTDKGEIIEAGDSQQKFTIQSISKIIALMLAVEDRGEKEVLAGWGILAPINPSIISLI